MKKNILIISLIAVFILGSFTFAFASLLPQRDNIQFSETVLFGDPKAAAGLILNYRNHYDYHLFWDTTWIIGTPADTAVADYRFTAKEDREEPNMEPAITLESHDFNQYEVDGKPSGLKKAFDELAETANPDAENIRQIHIADYYQYYPISGTLNLPGLEKIKWNDTYSAVLRQTNLDEEYKHIIDTMKVFQDYFKIPVRSNDTMEIQVRVNSQGDVTSTRTGYGTDTLYSIETESVVTEDTCYFTFGTRSWDGQYVDTSQIPGGYGIYALPYSKDGALLDQMSTVYPLDPKTQIESMKLSSDQSRLFLFTEETDGYYFTEIKLETMETIQKLNLNVNGFLGHMLHVTDDYFAFCGTDSSDASGYRIFSRGESGQFKFDFLLPSPKGEERDYFNFYSEAAFAYDGERAALTGTAVSTSHWGSAFTVAVYDKTGMLYCGEYNTGQNCRESSQGRYDCVPVANQLAEISWS